MCIVLPGHVRFYNDKCIVLIILDGVILVIYAKDGVQAQTRILFHALQK